MSEHLDLDQMQAAYKAAVEEWIAAIKQEEALASVTHTVAEVDKWEGANFREDELRNKVKAAYQRSTLLPERRKMLQHWADFLDGLKAGAKVRSLKRSA